MASKHTYLTLTPDGTSVYRGGSVREARRAARDYAREGWIGREIRVFRDGERIVGYVPTTTGIEVRT